MQITKYIIENREAVLYELGEFITSRLPKDVHEVYVGYDISKAEQTSHIVNQIAKKHGIKIHEESVESKSREIFFYRLDKISDPLFDRDLGVSQTKKIEDSGSAFFE